jgi:hypothetical protein
LAKTDKDAIVSPLLVKILGLKTFALVLKKANELTYMTEKEDDNRERNSHVCRGIKNMSACCKVIYEEQQMVAVKLKLDNFFIEGENLSLQ